MKKGQFSKDIITEIKTARFHSIFVEEVTANNEEILTICFRYCDIQGKLMKLVDPGRLTTEHIAKKIFRILHLDMDKSKEM